MAERVALVTGGTGAIGSKICQYLARENFLVGALGHPSEQPKLREWKDALGSKVAVELADLGHYAEAATAIGRLQDLLGPADVLINAAGITRDARFAKMTPDHWRAVIASNLDSVYNCTHAVFDGMCTRGYGRIVNISSVNGQKGQFGQANYSAAKAGMHGLTMALAQEGARHGVTVNTVSPGYIETPMTGAIKPEALEKIKAQIPAGRMGRPSDIARTVLFLTHENCSYITGANIPVNGGLFMSA